MKALVGAFNQEKALEGAFSVIVQPVVEPMEHYTALTAVAAAAPPHSSQLVSPDKLVSSLQSAARVDTGQ